MNEYFVYIMTNHPRNTVLYTGVTNSLSRRGEEHTVGFAHSSFTKKYNVNRFIYSETFYSITDAINREKQIKSYSRQKKLNLIIVNNPNFEDILL